MTNFIAAAIASQKLPENRDQQWGYHTGRVDSPIGQIVVRDVPSGYTARNRQRNARKDWYLNDKRVKLADLEDALRKAAN
jgi:hypothetical protein